MTNTPKKTTTRRKPAPSADKAPPVYFLSLEVEKVLCFKDKQVLDLSDGNGNPAQWTVILGNNGVGKTTLLRCLAGMDLQFRKDNDKDALPLLAIHLPRGSFAWQEYIVRTSLRSLEGLPILQAEFSYGVSGYALNGGKNVQQQKRAKMRIAVEFDGRADVTWYELKELVCYSYGANRRMGESSLDQDISSKVSSSLFSEEATLINAEEWLLQTDYAAKSASGKTKSRLQKQLKQIFEALTSILPDVDEIRIAPADEDRPRPMAEFHTLDGWVHLSGLGLGYRTAIAWMVDLAVRLFRRYPDSPDPLAEPAIVLVDEIDLHLHPKWQRTIMSFLTERFPNTQFIVTAHSPLIVQAAKDASPDANIVLLTREDDRVIINNNPPIVENWRVDQILTSLFELPTARSANLEPLLFRREELLSKDHLTDADDAELQALTQQIGSLPTAETPEDIEAMNVIRRVAKLLEDPQSGAN